MNASPTNPRELLDRILLKLALTDDSQLGGELEKFLPVVLGHLGTNDESLRTKGLEVLTHINKRVRQQTQIPLPLFALVDQFVDPQTAPLQRNFLLIYLDMAITRSKPEDQHKAILAVLPALPSVAPAHQDLLMQLFVQVVQSVKWGSDKSRRSSELAFLRQPAAKKVFVDFVYEFLLYSPSVVAPNLPSPGLSEKAMKRVQSKQGIQNLDQKKAHLVEHVLLPAVDEGLSEADVFPLFLIAMCDGYHQVQRAGEDAMKRISKQPLEEKEVVTKLFLLITGSKSTEEPRSPASATLRAKAVEFLLRSALAANSVPTNLFAILECFNGPQTTPKLRQNGIAFTQWVLRTGTDGTLGVIGPVILSSLLTLLDQTLSTDKNSMTRGAVYQAVGQLGKRSPALFKDKLDLLKKFFTKLESEEVAVRVSLQETLVSLCPAYAAATRPETLPALLQIFFDAVTNKNDNHSRYLANFFVNRLFPFASVPARFLNLLGASDVKKEVADEAKRGLKAYKLADNDLVADETAPAPDFGDLIKYLTTDAKVYSANNESLPFPSALFREVVDFARRVLKTQRTLSPSSGALVQSLVASHAENPLLLYRNILEEGLSPKAPSEVVLSASAALLDLFSFFFNDMVTSYVDRIPVLLPLLSRVRGDGRRVIAKIVGLVSPHLAPDAWTQLVSALLVDISSESSYKREEQTGAMLAVGHVLGRWAEVRGESHPRTAEVLLALKSLLSTASVSITAAEAIGAIGRFAPISKCLDAANRTEIVKGISGLMGSTSTDLAILETGAVALANLALGDRQLAVEDPLVLQTLYDTFRVKQEEVHFSIGDALSTVAAGWTSLSSADPLIDLPRASGGAAPAEPSGPIMASVLQKVLVEFLLGQRAETRTAASIWLLSLLKNAGKDLALQAELKRIQQVFSLLLGDPNEIVQEVAARGMVLVFELGDPKTQEGLVESLLSTLQQGQKGFKVSEDSTVFDEGAVNKINTSITTASGAASSTSSTSSANDKGQVATYKELLGLATELNQPDLVYRFMQLSSHHALWNSKKGAAFAATTLATRAEEKIKPRLPKLVPKLYRSSYDPNPKVAGAMTNILNALVDQNKVGNLYFDPIAKDLLENMFNRQWRTRESACFALADLLSGKTFEQVGPYLQELWEKTFKVSDDMKESVVKAAEKLSNALTSLTLRLCDPSYTKIEDGRKALDIALPFLLKKGLVSEAKNVRSTSVSLLLKISKIAGFLLKPHVTELVDTLLESLSMLEPAELNYVSLNADKYGVGQDVIDSARVEITKLSPINDTLDFCLKQVDSENIKTLAPVLATQVQTGAGIASRIGAAQFMAQLALRRPDESKLAAHKLLHALKKGVLNRSAPLRKTAASAIGALTKHAKQTTINQVLTALLDVYKQAAPDDDSTRLSVAEALLEMVRNASQVIQPFYKSFIPITFLARFDPNEDTKKLFSQIWDECGASLSLYLSEVVDVLIAALEDSRWTMKKQGAAAVAALSDVVNDYAIKDLAPKIFATLLGGLKGRIWTGKESLFEALAKFTDCCRYLFFPQTGEEVKGLQAPKDIIAGVLVECRKKNLEYKKNALICLAALLASFDAGALTGNRVFNEFELVRELLIEGVSKRSTPEDEEAPSGEVSAAEASPKPAGATSKDESQISLAIRMNCIKALANGWPRDEQTQRTFLPAVVALLVKELETNQFALRVSVMNGVKTLVGKLSFGILDESSFAGLLAMQTQTLADPNYSSVRTVAADVLTEFVTKAKDSMFLIDQASALTQTLRDVGRKFATISYATDKIIELLNPK